MASLDTPSASHAIRRAIVIGAGPAGLAAAEVLAQAGVSVTLHERMPNPARKLLLAGRGGLNLTHSEPLETFLSRYGAARGRLAPAINAFPPEALRAWSEALGVETFVGSSGRIFPKAMKASPLLRAWLARLGGMGVELVARSRWAGWEDGALVFETPEGRRSEATRRCRVRAGRGELAAAGIGRKLASGVRCRGRRDRAAETVQFGLPRFMVRVFKDKFAGEPIKRSRFSFNGHDVRGEAVATAYGIEGGAIYALSAPSARCD